MENILLIFRFNLRLLRSIKGYSAKELSNILEMSGKRISDLEEGKTPPTLKDLWLITSEFKINFDTLLYSKIEVEIKK